VWQCTKEWMKPVRWYGMIWCGKVGKEFSRWIQLYTPPFSDRSFARTAIPYISWCACSSQQQRRSKVEGRGRSGCARVQQARGDRSEQSTMHVRLFQSVPSNSGRIDRNVRNGRYTSRSITVYMYVCINVCMYACTEEGRAEAVRSTP
jgi:hypothetical protein